MIKWLLNLFKPAVCTCVDTVCSRTDGGKCVICRRPYTIEQEQKFWREFYNTSD